MNIERVAPDLKASHLRRTVEEHVAVLGLELVMDHGWIVTLADSDGHQLNFVEADASAPENPDVSVFVDDVRDTYARALAAGVDIVHPLTEEAWGVTRFFYRDASGNVINVGMHWGC
ncbi:VOC family protein [Microbacterium karelineae]|uniref:VOC family protein n=1 Tax=Microbacterium karelineae TaxID=2654283 RepID=UPI0012EAE3BB|nr:VOC family protein [Microbacterium karelineae]